MNPSSGAPRFGVETSQTLGTGWMLPALKILHVDIQPLSVIVRSDRKCLFISSLNRELLLIKQFETLFDSIKGFHKLSIIQEC